MYTQVQPPTPFGRIVFTADWSKYNTPGNDFDRCWQLQLAAFRAETAAKQEARRTKNLRKYGLLPKAA